MKKLYNRVISIFLCALMLCSITGCTMQKEKTQLEIVQDRGKLVVGTKFDTRPFGFIDKDKTLKGFDIDLSREIARRLFGSPDAVTFKQVTSSDRIYRLTAGEIDFIAATMTINDRRKRVVDFSMPYYIAGQAILVPKKSDIYGITDLNNKRVAFVVGSTSESTIRELAPAALLMGFKTYTDALNAVKINRVNAILADDTILKGFIYNNPNYKILNHRYTEEPYGIAYRKDPSAISFQDQINQIMSDLNTDGTLQKLRNKWIN